VSIVLYSADECPFCVRTRLVLAGKGVDHDLVEVDLGNKPGWLREMNPRNRVPVIRDGDAVLWESEALNEYLEEVHPDPAMMPGDPAGRARVRALLRRFEDLSDAYYAARRGEQGAEADVREQLAWLDERLSAQPHLAGDEYSLAEPGWWPWIVRMPRIGIDLEGEYAAVAAWCERLARRPEYAAELSLLSA
jgi:glutathione S-transferase